MPGPRRTRRLLGGLVLTAVACATAATVAPGANGATAGFGYGTPAFVNSAAPAGIDSPFGPGGLLTLDETNIAGEPSIGVNWNTGKALFQADAATYRLSFDDTKTPPAITWQDASSTYSPINVDPILATDPTTGITIAGGDDGGCAVMSRTTNDGATWSPSVPCPFAADHPTVAIGPFAGAAPVGASGTRAAYFCQHTDLIECSRSLDGGATWSPGTPTVGCAGTSGHAKVSADGTVYVPNMNCVDDDGNLAVGADVSTNNGLTWTSYGIAGAPEPDRGFDPSVTTTPDNTVYESWARAGDYHPVVTWSRDHGATWAPQVDLADTVSPPLTGSTFQAMVAGDNGRAAVAYLGTRTVTAGKTPFDTGFNGVWYVFVSYTYDGGATWTTVQATPEPVQRGSVDDGGTTTSGQRNLLDFFDAGVTKDGRVVVGYADGCVGGCNGPSGTVAQSQDAWATVAYQATGKGLFARGDVTPVSVPSAPVLTAADSGGAVALSWATPDDGGAPVTGYTLYRGSSAGTETAYATLGAVTSYVDSSVTPGTTYFYRLAAVNSVGVGPLSPSVSATPTTVPAAPSLSAAGGNQRVSLSWAAPADGGAAITGYRVLRGTAPGTETEYATVGAVTSYTDTAVTAGTTYFYRLAAVNSNGSGSLSPSVSATPTTVPGAPVLTATPGKSGGVVLTWTAPSDGGAAITGYAIYRATASGAETLYQTITSGTTYVDPATAARTTYYYKVAALNANGTGALSNEAGATPKK